MLTRIDLEEIGYSKHVKHGYYIDHVVEFINSDFEAALVSVKNKRPRTIVAGLQKAINHCKRTDIKVSQRGDSVYLVRYKDI